MDDDPPDCADLLDDFIEIAREIAPGDTLILKIANNCASIELVVDGLSVFKQERRIADAPPEKPVNPN